MVDAQKKQLFALRSDHDQIAVYQLDIDTAQRAYDAVTQRLGLVNLEGQNYQPNARLLSSAVEPLEPSRPKILLGIIDSLVGGLLAGLLVALALEMRDRRVRGVPVKKQRALCLWVIVGSVFSLGHAWAFDPPAVGIVDTALLLTQWVGTLIVGGIAFFLLKDRS